MCKNEKSKDYCKADNNMYCFFRTTFRLVTPAFFRLTNVTELMIGVTILYRWRMSQEICISSISSILTPILEPVQTFLTPKKHYLQAFFLSIYPLSQKLRQRFTIFLKFVSSCHHQLCVNRVNFLYYMKFYLLFRVNFLYSKVVFH